MRNISLNDSTQLQILPILEDTERLLAAAASKASGRPVGAEIITMPDLGMPHNVTRICGGFFTGAMYTWESAAPIVPIDATINVDTISVFSLHHPHESEKDFRGAIQRAREVSHRGSYCWNFEVGNHFVTLARRRGAPHSMSGSHVLVLHSSAAEFKHQHNGLYPTDGNWYCRNIETVDLPSGRYLRFLHGRVAERFYALASELREYNRSRHAYFAELVSPPGSIESEVVSVPHYGMPSQTAAAVGVQWVKPGEIVPLLTGPNRPIFLFRAKAQISHTWQSDGGELLLYPHGLGKACRDGVHLSIRHGVLHVDQSQYRSGDSLEDDDRFVLRDLWPGWRSGQPPERELAQILDLCPADLVEEYEPVFSSYRSNADTRC